MMAADQSSSVAAASRLEATASAVDSTIIASGDSFSERWSRARMSDAARAISASATSPLKSRWSSSYRSTSSRDPDLISQIESSRP